MIFQLSPGGLWVPPRRSIHPPPIPPSPPAERRRREEAEIIRQIVPLRCPGIAPTAWREYDEMRAMMGTNSARRAVRGPTANAAWTGITSYWKLEEASGNRVDAITATGNDLTPVNTPGNHAGIIGNALSIVQASHQSVTHSTNATLDQSGSFTFTLWYFRLDTSNMGMISKWDSSNGYIIGWGSATATFNLFNSPNSGSKNVNDGAANTWHFICCRHTNGVQLSVQIDGGSEQTQAYTHGVGANVGDFYIGLDHIDSRWFSGYIDEVALFQGTVISSSAYTHIYNGGSGNQWPN